jgi:hypothetical protein
VIQCFHIRMVQQGGPFVGGHYIHPAELVQQQSMAGFAACCPKKGQKDQGSLAAPRRIVEMAVEPSHSGFLPADWGRKP